jgi:hypothetical protein
MSLPVETRNVHVSQEADPRLYAYDQDNKLQVYDGRLLRLQRTIDDTGFRGGALLQALAPND